MTAEWVTAGAAVLSLPISIWAMLEARKNSKNIKQIAQKVGITMEGNTIIGGGTMVHFGDRNDKK